MAASFATLLKQLKKQQFDTLQAFAEALGIRPSQLSRSMRGGLPFDINGCLKLARVTGHPADDVLRKAGKKITADLILEVYGLKQGELTAMYSEEHRELIRLYDAVKSRHAQTAFFLLLKTIDSLQEGMPDYIASGLDVVGTRIASRPPAGAPLRSANEDAPHPGAKDWTTTAHPHERSRRQGGSS